MDKKTKKIDVAAILKDKPQGTKLFDLATNLVVSFNTVSVTEDETVIWCFREEGNTTTHFSYSEFGTTRGYPDGIVLLVPSKEMQDWAQYVKPEFKDGDIVYMDIKSLQPTQGGWRTVSIYKECVSGVICVYASMTLNDMCFMYDVEAPLVNEIHVLSRRLATDSERQKLFDSLAKEGKRWNAEKKQIEDLPKEHELKPFDKVLVRDSDNKSWKPAFFSFLKENSPYPYYVIPSESEDYWSQCIPYEGNEHLLGTNNKPE